MNNIIIYIFLIKGRLTTNRRNIILFRYKVFQIIFIEKKNKEKRNLKKNKRRLKFNYNNSKSEERREII